MQLIIKIFGLLILFISLNALRCYGQDKRSFIEVDTTTYNLYLSGQWDELVREGNKAIDSGTDYFYLRMRIAYALFMQKKYRAAIPHYEKAIQFNRKDIYANAYLLHSYVFSGRKNDAIKLSGTLTPTQNPDLYKNYSKTILSIGVFYTYNTARSEQIQQSIADNNNLTTDGIQKATNFFHLPQVFLSHRIGRSVILNHTIGYLHKNEFSYAVEQTTGYPSPGQTLKQYNYSLSAQITPFKGFSITPSYNYIFAKIPLYNQDDYGFGKRMNRPVVAYIKENSAFYSLLVQQDFKLLKAGISYGFGHLNRIDQQQKAVHATIYPLSNLNLYYAFDGYHQKQTYDNQNDSKYIYKHLIGFKVNNHLWIEASGNFSEHMNFFDTTGDIIYNGLEGVKNEYNFRGIIPLKNTKATIITNVGYYQSISEFIPNDFPFSRSNSYTYNNINISGGILWTL